MLSENKAMFNSGRSARVLQDNFVFETAKLASTSLNTLKLLEKVSSYSNSLNLDLVITILVLISIRHLLSNASLGSIIDN